MRHCLNIHERKLPHTLLALIPNVYCMIWQHSLGDCTVLWDNILHSPIILLVFTKDDVSRDVLVYLGLLCEYITLFLCAMEAVSNCGKPIDFIIPRVFACVVLFKFVIHCDLRFTRVFYSRELRVAESYSKSGYQFIAMCFQALYFNCKQE